MGGLAKNQAAAETEKSAIDVKLLVRALIELNIARKNFLIYPPGHAQTRAGVALAAHCLDRFLENCAEIRLGFAKNTIWVGEHSIDPGNAVLRELATAMKALQIAGLRIAGGFTTDELETLLKRLAVPAAESGESGGGPPGAPAGGSLELGHMTIDWIDYSLFGHTEEAAIHHGDPDAPGGRTDSLWYDYIRLLTACDEAPVRDGANPKYSPQLTPSSLAGLLNRLGELDEKAQKSYEKVIHEHLRNARRRSFAGPRKSGANERFKDFLQELNPLLRKQFLSITFDQCAAHPDAEAVEGFIDTFPPAVLVEMLDQASREGKAFSPALISFMHKLGHCGPGAGEDPQAEALEELTGGPAGRGPAGAGGLLFRQEEATRYMTPEYAKALKEMAARNFADAQAEPDDFDLDTHLASLAEPELTGCIATALMAFLETSQNPEVYREYAEALFEQLEDLLQDGRHNQVLEIHALFSTHGSGHAGADIREAAREMLERFKGTRLIAKMVSLVEDGSGLEEHEAVDFLTGLGPAVIPHLLDLALGRNSGRVTRLVKSIARKYPEQTAAEFAARLDGGPAADVAGVVALVDAVGDRQSVFRLRPCLKSPHPDLRSRVLGMLLKHRDPYAVPFLSRMLDSGDIHEVCAGIDLAGEHAVTEMAPKLRGMIRHHFLLFRSDCLVNTRIFSALEKMGCPPGDGGFRHLSRRRYSLCPQEFSSMKKALAQWTGGGHPQRLAAASPGARRNRSEG